MKSKKIKKKKLNLIKCLIFFLILYLIGYSIYYMLKEPIRNIVIAGNNVVTDAQIIEAAGIKNYPSFFKLSSKKIKKNVQAIPLIYFVSVKKDLNRKITITVSESKIVFLNKTTNKLMLGSGKYIDNTYDYTHVPTLVNYAPETTLLEFAKELGQVNQNIINEISEIIYEPSKNESDELIDGTRFKLMMIDGNTIYTNSSKCSILNYYQQIFASLENPYGTYNLDSGNYENFVFIPYTGA